MDTGRGKLCPVLGQEKPTLNGSRYWTKTAMSSGPARENMGYISLE